MSSPAVQRALISVSDKTGLAAFARALTDAGVEIFSNGRHPQAFGVGRDRRARHCPIHGLSGDDARTTQNVAPQGVRRNPLPP